MFPTLSEPVNLDLHNKHKVNTQGVSLLQAPPPSTWPGPASTCLLSLTAQTVFPAAPPPPSNITGVLWTFWTEGQVEGQVEVQHVCFSCWVTRIQPRRPDPFSAKEVTQGCCKSSSDGSRPHHLGSALVAVMWRWGKQRRGTLQDMAHRGEPEEPGEPGGFHCF